MSSTATGIQWTDATWNPVRGCSRISPGCEHCYAEKIAARFSRRGLPFAGIARQGPNGPRWTGQVQIQQEALAQPLRWKAPRRIFVNSMSDLFHESLSNEGIADIFAVMAAARQHTFQVLTKRAGRMRQWFDWWQRWINSPEGFAHIVPSQRVHAALRYLLVDAVGERLSAAGPFGSPWPLPNVWLGVSVEDQEWADKRVPLLLETPAALRFVSYEPALGPIDLGPDLHYATNVVGHIARGEDIVAPRIDWVIVGGESGPGARPFDLGWGRKVVQDCKEAGVPVFVKQLGAVALGSHARAGGRRYDFANRKGGDPAEWPADLRVREFPAVHGHPGTPGAEGGGHAMDHPVPGARL